jgi:hypothetical protein
MQTGSEPWELKVMTTMQQMTWRGIGEEQQQLQQQ